MTAVVNFYPFHVCVFLLYSKAMTKRYSTTTQNSLKHKDSHCYYKWNVAVKKISDALSLIRWLGPDGLKAANKHSNSQCATWSGVGV